MTDNLDEAAQEQGFADREELFHLVAAVPFANVDFLAWRNDDGSKTGLVALIKWQSGRAE